MPEISIPTDAIIKITKTTICGTDLHILKAMYPAVDQDGFWGMRE
jgi:alcohol dehydrogenase